MDSEDLEAVKTVTDGLMKIILECHDKVGKDFEPTRGDFEVAGIPSNPGCGTGTAQDRGRT